MKLVHVAPFAPGRCGLYETVRDLVVAERKLGHDAVLVDSGVPGEGSKAGAEDQRDSGTVVASPSGAADGADVVVTHSTPPRLVLEATDAPIVHVLHGRPRSSYLLELRDPKTAPVWASLAKWVTDPRRVLFVNPWPEHAAAWRCVVPADRLATLSGPPVDLTEWSPDGPEHVWEVRTDGPRANVLVCDVWRDDVDPFHVLVDLAEAAAQGAQIVVHVYGLPGLRLQPAVSMILARLREHGALGEVRGHMRGMAAVYRAADVVVTPQEIDTRTVREALACGTPVLRAQPRGELAAHVRDARGCCLRRSMARAAAARFDAVKIAREFVSRVEAALTRQGAPA